VLAQHSEAVDAEFSPIARFWNAAPIVEDQPQTTVRHDRHPTKGFGLRFPILKFGIRDSTSGAGPGAVDVQNVIVRIHMRESAEEHGVGYGEDRGIDPDTDSKYCDCHRRESRTLE
jgi:hypothetical protein